MKKRLMILPLIALVGGVLAGCDDSKKDDPQEEEYPGLDASKVGPKDVFGHKRVKKLEDGKSYYFAVCKRNIDGEPLMFMNGEPHKDGGKEYPFYLGETEIDDEADLETEAAKITVEFVDDEGKEFNLKVEKEGAKNNQTYLGIYKATSSYTNPVLSFYCSPELGADHPNDDGGTDATVYNFSWLYEYEGYAVDTAVMMLADERKEEDEPLPKFIGTGGEFVSMDCAQTDKGLEEEYNFAYFYEV